MKKKTVGKQRFRRWSISKTSTYSPLLQNKYLFHVLLLSQSILIISDILTKIYKITIDCFKPTISVGFDPYSRKVLLGRPSAFAGQ